MKTKTKRVEDVLAMPEFPKSKERAMVMLEIPFEKTDYSGKHKKEVLKFLRDDLGLDAAFKYGEEAILDFDDMIIDGIEVKGDFRQASSIGFNAFTRKQGPRKQRQVVLSIYSNQLCVIYINKPMDKLRLLDKINGGILEKKENLATSEAKRAHADTLIRSLYERYNPITGFVSVIIRDGVLTMNVEHGAMQVNSDGIVTGCSVNAPEVITVEDLSRFAIKSLLVSASMLIAKGEIEKLGPTGVTADTWNASAWVRDNNLIIQ